MMNLQLFAEKNIPKQSSASLKKGIRSYQNVIDTHNAKIANPEKFYPEWNTLDPIEQAGSIRHWNKEIRNAQQSMNDRIEELKKRGDYDA